MTASEYQYNARELYLLARIAYARQDLYMACWYQKRARFAAILAHLAVAQDWQPE